MNRFAAVLSALALAGCASVAAPFPTGEGAAACDFTVAFGSYGSGVDTVLRERIVRALAGDRRVAGTQERRWGREGESTLCVNSRNNGDVDGLIGEINAMIAAQVDLRGPTAVARGGASFPPA